jgi:hypothetical protein
MRSGDGAPAVATASFGALLDVTLEPRTLTRPIIRP